MMPLPTYALPRHETESRIPAQTRRALRWEGVAGTLPVRARKPWLARLWARLTRPAPPPATPERLLRTVSPLLRPREVRLPPPERMPAQPSPKAPPVAGKPPSRDAPKPPQP